MASNRHNVSSSVCSYHHCCSNEPHFYSYFDCPRYCCPTTFECTRVAVNGEITIKANDALRLFEKSPSLCNEPYPALETVPRCPDSPVSLPSRSYQCCSSPSDRIKTPPKKKKRKKRLVTTKLSPPLKETATQPEVVVVRSFSIGCQTQPDTVKCFSVCSQTEPPSAQKNGTQTEEPPRKSCVTQTLLPPLAFGSTQTEVPEEEVVEEEEKNPCPLPESEEPIKTDSLVRCVRECENEMEKRRRSRRDLLRKLLWEERRQKKRLRSLTKKVRQKNLCQGRLMQDLPKPGCSTRMKCSSSSDLSPESCLEVPPSKPPSATLPKDQVSVAKMLNYHLKEAHKIGKDLTSSEFLETLVAPKKDCRRDRRLIDLCKMEQERSKKDLFLASDTLLNCMRRKEGNKCIPLDFRCKENPLETDLHQAGVSRVKECYRRKSDEYVEDSPGRQRCTARRDERETLERFDRQPLSCKRSEFRLAGGGDKYPLSFPLCHRVMLSGTLSRVNNCPLVNHMRSMGEMFRAPFCHCLTPHMEVDEECEDIDDAVDRTYFPGTDNQSGHRKPKAASTIRDLSRTLTRRHQSISANPPAPGNAERRLYSGETPSTSGGMSRSRAMVSKLPQPLHRLSAAANPFGSNVSKSSRSYDEWSHRFSPYYHFFKKRSLAAEPTVRPGLLPVKEDAFKTLGFVRDPMRLQKVTTSMFPVSPIQARYCNHLYSSSNHSDLSPPNVSCSTPHHPHSIASLVSSRQSIRPFRTSKSLTFVPCKPAAGADDSFKASQTNAPPRTNQIDSSTSSYTTTYASSFSTWPSSSRTAAGNPNKDHEKVQMKGTNDKTTHDLPSETPNLSSSYNNPRDHYSCHSHSSKSMSGFCCHTSHPQFRKQDAQDKSHVHPHSYPEGKQSSQAVQRPGVCCCHLSDSLASRLRHHSRYCTNHRMSLTKEEKKDTRPPSADDLARKPTEAKTATPNAPIQTKASGSEVFVVHNLPNEIWNVGLNQISLCQLEEEGRLKTLEEAKLAEIGLNQIRRLNDDPKKQQNHEEVAKDPKLSESNEPITHAKTDEEPRTETSQANSTECNPTETASSHKCACSKCSPPPCDESALSDGATSKCACSKCNPPPCNEELTLSDGATSKCACSENCRSTTCCDEPLTTDDEPSKCGDRCSERGSPSFADTLSQCTSSYHQDPHFESPRRNEPPLPFDEALRGCAEAIMSRIQRAKSAGENLHVNKPLKACAEAFVVHARSLTNTCPRGDEFYVYDPYGSHLNSIKRYRSDHLVTFKANGEGGDSDDSDCDSVFEGTMMEEEMEHPVYSPLGQPCLFPSKKAFDPGLRQLAKSYHNLISLMSFSL